MEECKNQPQKQQWSLVRHVTPAQTGNPSVRDCCRPAAVYPCRQCQLDVFIPEVFICCSFVFFFLSIFPCYIKYIALQIAIVAPEIKNQVLDFKTNKCSPWMAFFWVLGIKFKSSSCMASTFLTDPSPPNIPVFFFLPGTVPHQVVWESVSCILKGTGRFPKENIASTLRICICS